MLHIAKLVFFRDKTDSNVQSSIRENPQGNDRLSHPVWYISVKGRGTGLCFQNVY